MKTITYKKLVRDRIPEIVQCTGQSCITETLSDDEYLYMIDAKLDEKLAEYHKDQSIEALADLLEVIYTAAKARGYTLDQLETVRAEKAAKYGAFNKKFLLKSVFSPNEYSSDLVPLILQNEAEILNIFDYKMMSTYCWLQGQLYKRNVATDLEYRRKFAGYYRMRFVSQEYREAFFNLFEKLKNEQTPSFREASFALYEIDQKHEFSFISKMLHTINPHKPIFDSQVCEVLHLQRYYQASLEAKLRQDELALARIANSYAEMTASERIQEMLARMDSLTPGCQITVEKKCDFILWALGGILKKR